SVLPESLETFADRALPARKHRRIAQRVGTGFSFAKLLDQIEKVGRIVSLESDDKLLIVKTKGIGGVQLYRAIFHADADMFIHHLLSLLGGSGVPFTSFHEGVNKKIL